MNKKIKIWLIVATSLFIIGSIIFVGALGVAGWNFRKLSTIKTVTNNYELTEEFSNVSILTNTTDIEIVKTTEKSKVVCIEQKNVEHKVEVKDGTLYIEVNDERKWYDYIGINFDDFKIKVYLSNSEYDLLKIKGSTCDAYLSNDITYKNLDVSLSTGDVECYASILEHGKIHASTGDITVKNQSSGSLELEVTSGDVELDNLSASGDVSIKVSTGDVEIDNVTLKNLTSYGSTGDIELTGVIASEKITITRDTGDVEFKRSDANEIYVKTDTGDVEGSLLSEKIFIVNTSSGHKNVPSTVTGGRCEITTDTGDVKITIAK